MADEKELNETPEETVPEEAAVEETPAAEVEETPVAEETPAADEAPAEPDEAPVAEEAPVADDAPAAEEAPAAAPVAKPSKSQRHLPRTARRTRTKVVREKPASRKPITRTEKPDYERGRRQERRGVVVSDKGDKTIIVKVDVIKSHPKYKKVIRSTVKFHAHDEANTAGVGDKVRIVETRPLSKLKHWRLAEITEKAK
jgi:small subunit ribosomal protein S17